MTETTIDDFWTWGAARLRRAIGDGSVSSREVVSSCLARLAQTNPHLGAVVDIDEDGALAAAERVDESVKRGDRLGKLAGVPIVTKVNVDQRGSATTNGVPEFRDRIAEHDNPVIANLRDAGAIILGRSTTPAFSWRWFTNGELYGETLNPWNPDITSGGSSGGSAVAVATGMVPLAHGSDLAGSIRYPAMACGVLGLRPTLGRVPSSDPSAPNDRPPFAQLLGSQGPMARTVEDLRLGLDVMATASPLDPWAVPVPVTRSENIAPCRVAMVRDVPWADVDPQVTREVEIAASRLEKAGYEIIEATPPEFETSFEIYRAVLWEATHGLLNQIDKFGDESSRGVAMVLREFADGLDVSQYLQLFGRRTGLIRKWSMFLADHPLLLMPVSWQRTFPVDYDRRGADEVRNVMKSLAPSYAVNICGLPAVAVPTSADDIGPLGVQIVGGRFEEERCLTAAEVVGPAEPMMSRLPNNTFAAGQRRGTS